MSYGSKNGWFNFAKKLPSTKVTFGTGVSGTEGFAGTKTITIPFSAKAVSVVDTGGTAGGQGSLKLLDFPAGLITVLGATTNIALVGGTGIGATAAVVASLGTVAASTADATLTSTEANVIASTAATLTASAGVFAGKSTAPVVLDGTATAVPLYLNFAIPDGAGQTATGNLTLTGSLTLTYVASGDY